MNEIETLEEKIQRVKNEVIRITGLDVRFIKNKKRLWEFDYNANCSRQIQMNNFCIMRCR